MSADRMPILVGTGQVTKKDEPLKTCSSPVDLILESARRAAENTTIGSSIFKKLDLVVLVRSFREVVRNSPQLVADVLGAKKARCYLTPHGGNVPQYLVNRYSEAIARGELDLVLLGGAEALDNQIRCDKAGVHTNWEVKQDSDFEYLYPNKGFSTKSEHKHGLSIPANCYPMFETALCHHYGDTIEEHQMKMGKLFASFSAVAAKTSTAWYPMERSAEEVAMATSANRYVGWPYTKFMNAMNNINQGAALLMTSVGRAKALGIPEDKWIYLHGCANANEINNVSERVNYHSSPAIRKVGEVAFEQAGFCVEDIDFIDIYSCFPVAVQIARDMLGISTDDPRPLTVTGGLPYHGGAGSNYVMNSIATMTEILRAHPGKKGMVTANGGYLTKHSLGLYSTEPVSAKNGEIPWSRRDPAEYQAEIDAEPHPEVDENPHGKIGTVEAYTILFDRSNEPMTGLALGRLESGRRFYAHIHSDQNGLKTWTQQSAVGQHGQLSLGGDKINRFTFI